MAVVFFLLSVQTISVVENLPRFTCQTKIMLTFGALQMLLCYTVWF